MPSTAVTRITAAAIPPGDMLLLEAFEESVLAAFGVAAGVGMTVAVDRIVVGLVLEDEIEELVEVMVMDDVVGADVSELVEEAVTASPTVTLSLFVL